MTRRLLAGKTCLVTGASRGLGRAIARRFWVEGANLVIAVRDPESVLNLLANMDRAQQQSMIVLRLDVVDMQSMTSLANSARDNGVEKLDVLVNNAAVLGPIGRAWETSTDDWTHTITGNLVAPALICASFVPMLAQSANGKIINLSGGGATGPRPNFSAYAAAKAGLVRFSETLALEVKHLGIDVNCVAPGPMATDMLNAIYRAGPELAGTREHAAAEKAQEKGEASMSAAVDLIAFLASDRSNGISGKLIAALWDNWQEFPDHLRELDASDVCTLRRIAGRDRDLGWCDK